MRSLSATFWGINTISWSFPLLGSRRISLRSRIGIGAIRVDVVADEIEKRRQVGITDVFGVRLVAVGNAVQKRQDLIGRKLSNLSISKILTESVNQGPLRLDSFFIRMGVVW